MKTAKKKKGTKAKTVKPIQPKRVTEQGYVEEEGMPLGNDIDLENPPIADDITDLEKEEEEEFDNY